MGLTASGLQFFPDQFTTGRWEGLAQYVHGFNAASANAIELRPGNTKGRGRTTTFFPTNSGFVQRRDPESTGNTTWQVLSNQTHTTIKVYRNSRYKYYGLEAADLGLTEKDMQLVWGTQFGELQAQEMLNTGLAALVGAIESMGGAAELDIIGDPTETMHFEALNNGMAKMGDMSQGIRALAMHSRPWHSLIGDAIVNQKFAPDGANLVINEGTTRTMNRVPMITDSPSFVSVDAGPPVVNNYKTLGLFSQALGIELNPQDERFEFGLIMGDGANTPENISYGLMVDWAFTLNIRGVKYKEASVKNPDLSTLADPSNWALVHSDPKLGPGFVIKSL